MSNCCSFIIQLTLLLLWSLPLQAATLKTPCVVTWDEASLWMMGTFTWKYPEVSGGAVRQYYEINCSRGQEDSYKCFGTRLSLNGIEEKGELGFSDVARMEGVTIHIGGVRSKIARISWGDYSFVLNDGGSTIEGMVVHPKEGTFTSSCAVDIKSMYLK